MSWPFSTLGKIVVVTGGGSGIGLSYAVLAVANGAKSVIIGDIALTDEAQKVAVRTANLTFQHWADLQRLIDVCITKSGDVPDIYVASAGVFEPPYSNFWEDPEPLDNNGYKHVDINVNHPIKFTRLAMRALLGKQKQGVVALVSSISGYSKQYSAPIYSATKHAVVGFTRSLGDAQRLQSVKVISICPGIVSTPIWTTGTPGSGERFGIVEDISITPEVVAKTISEGIESPEYPGGTILEVSKLGTRVVPEWFIQPPGMVDGKMPEGTDVAEHMLVKSLEPIMSVTERERGKMA
ncbi:unnamed protein product [Clonostachys rhizophaga]|uniref:NAD(P)-binding protein n=1 Tax=Clonostachys rhizophaga TaxID=160324 RepID=A0A9N9VC18_9HYPO|nr:unnamed protein product [Clonostachys rhizophaga]